MGLETATYISGLVASNPINATDVVGEGDDHIRLLKSTILNSFPGITGAMTMTHTQLNNALVKTEGGTISGTVLISAGTTPGTPSLALETTRPVLVFDDSNASADEGRYYLHSNSGQFAIVAINDANDTSQTVMLVDRTAENVDSVQLLVDNLVNLKLEGGGQLALRSAGNTDTENRRLTYDHQDGTARGFVGYSTSSALRLNNQIHGGTLILAGEDAGGTAVSFLEGDPDNTTRLYHSGAECLRTRASGVTISGDTAASSPPVASDNPDVRLLLADIANTNTLACFGYASSSSLIIRNQIHGGLVSIQGETTAGSVVNLIEGDPDAYVSLYAADEAEAFRTQEWLTSGNTSSALVKDHSGNFRDVGFNDLPVITEDANDTLEAAHAGGVFFKDGTIARTLTLEGSGGSDFPIGGVCTIINANDTGDISVDEGTGTTLYILDGSAVTEVTSNTATVAPGSVATLWREAAGIYYIFGNGVS